MSAGFGQQLDFLSPPVLVDLLSVLSTSAAHPSCGCTSGYLQRAGRHTGLYCAGHGRWLSWLDRQARERAERAMRAGGDV